MIEIETSVLGRYVISYCRTRLADTDVLQRALDNVGIPTWRDTRNLSCANSANEIDRILSSESTAGALLYLTPEVCSSNYVLDLEVPGVFRRAHDPNFLIVPIASGGLSYESAGSMLAGHTGIHRLEGWNMEHIPSDVLTPELAERIADRVLSERFQRVALGMPIRIDASTRSPLAFSADVALSVDHRDFFPDRLPSVDDWPVAYRALQRVRETIHQYSSTSPIEVSGQVALGYACALGTIFSATSGLQAAWMQRREGNVSERWSLACNPLGDLQYDVSLDQPGNQDIALLLLVNDDVRSSFGRSRGSRRFGAVVTVDFRDRQLTTSDAVALARSAVRAAREARSKCPGNGTLHIFAAAPAGVMFLLGQLLNTFDNMQMYEFLNGQYEPSLSIRPNQ